MSRNRELDSLNGLVWMGRDIMGQKGKEPARFWCAGKFYEHYQNYYNRDDAIREAKKWRERRFYAKIVKLYGYHIDTNKLGYNWFALYLSPKRGRRIKRKSGE